MQYKLVISFTIKAVCGIINWLSKFTEVRSVDYICKMCGEIISIADDTGVCECEHCGSRQTVPTEYSDEYAELHNKACKLLLNNDIYSAEKLFRELSEKVPDESEAYWGIVLCCCGVKYTDDPVTGMKAPFITRQCPTDIDSCQEYIKALRYATEEQSRFYRREAAAIEMLRRDMIERVESGESYDIFICCREYDKNNDISKESIIASQIYEQLKKEGLKTFFAPETVKNIPENGREPYINSASLNSEILLIICTDNSSFDSAEFKKEWNKCASLAKKHSEKRLFVCIGEKYKRSIPKELSSFPTKDITNIGFLTELLRSIRNNEDKKVVIHSSKKVKSSPDKLIERVQKFLESEDFESAKEYSEMITEALPYCWQAHFMSFLAENGCRNSSDMMLEEFICGFASDYIERYGFDVPSEYVFRERLNDMLGESFEKAMECAEGDDKLKMATIYERFLSAVRDTVFAYEQENIAAEEKEELNEMRSLHIKEEQEKRAAERGRRKLMKKRIFAATVVLVAILSFVAIRFNYKWASVMVIITLITAAIFISELDK